jgi:hypothetical protein
LMLGQFFREMGQLLCSPHLVDDLFSYGCTFQDFNFGVDNDFLVQLHVACLIRHIGE